jgi:nucleotide-binding universal stress UspA family protein
MQGRILVPTSLSRESNTVFPWALTMAQAFPDKLYLLNVMDPDSVNKPEQLADFPALHDFFAKDRDGWFNPPLKTSVPSSKLYLYNDDVAKVILGVAKAKAVDLICMSVIRPGANFAWWSAGKTVETVIEQAPCSVLCVRGRAVREEDWQRPRFRHLLLLTELTPGDSVPLAKVMPLVQRFNAMLHIFPIGDLKQVAEQAALRQLCQQNGTAANVLEFKEPNNRTANLTKFIADTGVDMILMTPRIRAKFSNRLFSDIFVRLLRTTDVPVLLLR